MEFFVTLLTLIITTTIWIVLCTNIADKNNRNHNTAALLGLLFGAFAVIGYLIAGKKR